ncbi:response regulator [soil metagenome]
MQTAAEKELRAESPPPGSVLDESLFAADGLLEDEIIEASQNAQHELDRLSLATANLQKPLVLVLDDEPMVCDSVARFLSQSGFRAVTAHSGPELWSAIAKEIPHAVIVDVWLQGANGIDLVRQVVEKYPETVVMVTSGSPDVKVTIEALRAGAIDFLIKPIDFAGLGASLSRGIERQRARLKQLRYQLNLEQMILERTRRLIESSQHLTERTNDIGLAYRDLVVRLGRASQWRDDETGDHIQRIGLFSGQISLQMGLSSIDVDLLGEASPMHDIGKIGVPDSILLKPGRLTPLEFECMKAHTLIGAELLSGSEAPILKASEEIALSHHEWFNGGGYPYGLKGDNIPLFGKIVAVADVYDALVHDRNYKKAIPSDETISTMAARRGTQFDPEVFDAFLEIVGTFPLVEKAIPNRSGVHSKYNVEMGLFKMSSNFHPQGR